MRRQVIHISADGVIRFVWSDHLAPLLKAGTAEIRRASHVEPTDDGRWTADLAPIGGAVLGPFDLRGQALDEEQLAVEELLTVVPAPPAGPLQGRSGGPLFAGASGSRQEPWTGPRDGDSRQRPAICSR